MNIKKLQKAIYKQAQRKGLYKYPQSINALLWHIREEAAEAVRAWKKYNDLKVHYECTSKRIEDCAIVKFACDKCPYRSNEGVDQELADVIIMTLSACEHLGIDIEKAIKEKMAYNDIRKR